MTLIRQFYQFALAVLLTVGTACSSGEKTSDHLEDTDTIFDNDSESSGDGDTDADTDSDTDTDTDNDTDTDIDTDTDTDTDSDTDTDTDSDTDTDTDTDTDSDTDTDTDSDTDTDTDSDTETEDTEQNSDAGDTETIPEELCSQTGGVWDMLSCGHYHCGNPPDCKAIIPGCNCGPDSIFDSEKGCIESTECTSDPKSICEASGGEWLDMTCGNWLCGQPPICAAIIPGCNCGENRIVDLATFECIVSEDCL